MPCSPRSRIPLASVAAGLAADRTRLDSNSLRQLDTSHGCQDHTVLPYATTSLVLRGIDRSQPQRPPCNASRAQRHRVHRNPHSTYRDDAYAPLHEAGWREHGTDLGEMRSGIFLPRNLDDPNRVEMADEIRFLAQGFSRRLRWQVAQSWTQALAHCPDGQISRRREQGRCQLRTKDKILSQPFEGTACKPFSVG